MRNEWKIHTIIYSFYIGFQLSLHYKAQRLNEQMQDLIVANQISHLLVSWDVVGLKSSEALTKNLNENFQRWKESLPPKLFNESSEESRQWFNVYFALKEIK